MAKMFGNLPCSKHGKSCHDECLGFTVKISGGEFQCPLGLEKVPGAGLANWGLGGQIGLTACFCRTHEPRMLFACLNG